MLFRPLPLIVTEPGADRVKLIWTEVFLALVFVTLTAGGHPVTATWVSWLIWAPS